MFSIASFIKKIFAITFLSMILTGCGGPPDEIVRSAIIENHDAHAFTVSEWDELNSYQRKVDGETVHFIEYDAKMKIKPEYKKYVKSGGGISFPSATPQRKGTIKLIKRGNSWYSQ